MTQDITPLRQQYLDIKKQYPDTIVFFRLGDFYETFDDDAKATSEALDIVLTSRPVAKGVRVPMAGITTRLRMVSDLMEKGSKSLGNMTLLSDSGWYLRNTSYRIARVAHDGWRAFRFTALRSP